MKMMKLIPFKKLFSLGLTVISSFSFAQDANEEFKQVKEKYNSKEFEYTIDKTTEPKEYPNLNWLDNLLNSIYSLNWSYVMYTIIALVILLILYKLYQNGAFFKVNSKHAINNDEASFDFIEKNLLTVDLIEMINKAKAAKNYRLAIRYYHYQNTQNLAHKNYIKWDPKKTNQQLINQINKKEIKDLFTHNTLIFNQIWFGEFDVTEENFNTFETNFIFLNQRL